MNTQHDPMQAFYAQMKVNAEAKAKKMAALELSCWDEKHEQELKEHFGFNDKTLKKRKVELEKRAAAVPSPSL